MASQNNLLHEPDPNDDGGDSDYDELHLPDHEDEGDVSPNDEDFPLIPFSRIHELPVGLKNPKISFLISRLPIQTNIVAVERSTSTHFVNPNLYVIQLRHGDFQWTIRRRYKHFQHLHQQLQLFRTSLALPLPTRKHRERRKSIQKRDRKTLPRFPKKPDALLRQEQVERRREQMEEYLQAILAIPMYKNHHETLQFLEISPLSFVNDLGQKTKEGTVKKRSGGHRATVGCLRLHRALISCFGLWSKRWMVCKDSCIVLMRPSDGSIRAVLMFDHGFQVNAGLVDSGVYNGLQVSNLSRHLLFKCWTRRKVREWTAELNSTMNTTARDFTQPNRFESFVPVRANTDCRWFVDGATYMEAVADALESAREEIFITDWWLSPEIYLKRPIIQGEMWRLDHVLKRKAEQGIRIFVLLYKEVELALGINSLYSKQQLVRMHPNIKVLRHPDHMKDGVLLWAHHEKIVVIDQSYAFLGGIDLCYGRWDDYKHKLADVGGVTVTRKSLAVLNGPNLKKSRSLSDLIEYQPTADTVDKKTVSIAVVEDAAPPAGRDEGVSNGAVSDVKNEVEEPAEVKPKKYLRWKMLQSKVLERKGEDDGGHTPSKSGKKARRVLQAVARFQSLKRRLRRRSLDSLDSLKMGEDWDSIDASAAKMTQQTSEVGFNELGLQGTAKLWFGKDYSNFIVKDLTDLNQPYQDMVDRNVTPRMPWHDIGVFVKGSAARDVSRHFIQRWNATKFEKAKKYDRYPWLLPKSYDNVAQIRSISGKGNMFCASCQIVRSVSDWSAGIKTTEQSIHTAYVWAIHCSKHYIYIENQFFITQAAGSRDVLNEVGEALYRRIMRAHKNGEVFRVYVVMPLLPAFEGEIGSNTGTSIQAITHWNYASICRGPDSLVQRLKQEGVDAMSYITFYGLRTYDTIHDKLVTELLYVHSKLMIVDDCTVIIGSANINDRSLLGRRDSEIAVVVTDEEFEKSVMNGATYDAGKFACSLRRALFREHLGIATAKSAQSCDIRDPVSQHFFKEIWLKTAARNTTIFENVFRCFPNDDIRTFVELRQYVQTPPMAETDTEAASEQLKRIQGHLVLMPLQFLSGEVLTPASGTKEGLMPVAVWT